MHFLVKIHFGSSVSCKCNIYFWLEFRDPSYIYMKGCGSLYELKMFGNDVVRRNANFIYLMKFLNFRTHFGGTFKIKIKLAKIFVFEVL